MAMVMVDCLVCGSQAKCQQITVITNEGTKNWPDYFCQLLRIEDDIVKENLNQGFYCASCYSKIRSITITCGLIQKMKKSLVEMKKNTEDELLLSNFHHTASDDPNEPDSVEKTQSRVRKLLMDALEKRKSEAPITKDDKSVECLLLPEPEQIPPSADMLGDDTSTDKNDSKKHLVKIRLPSNITKDVLESLMRQSSTKSGDDAGQLIIQGFVERSSSNVNVSKQLTKSSSLEVMGNDVQSAFIEFEDQRGVNLMNSTDKAHNSVSKFATATSMEDGTNEDSVSQPSLQKKILTKGHKLVQRKKRQELPCTLCNGKFMSLQLLTNHMEVHKVDGYLSCPKCPIKVNNVQAFAHHQENKHEKVHSCRICAKAFTIAGLKRHLKVHEVGENGVATIPGNKRDLKESAGQHKVTKSQNAEVLGQRELKSIAYRKLEANGIKKVAPVVRRNKGKPISLPITATNNKKFSKTTGSLKTVQTPSSVSVGNSNLNGLEIQQPAQRHSTRIKKKTATLDW